MKAYAGIGSRETPGDILLYINTIGRQLALRGWTLRTGGAVGADKAFEIAHRDAQVYAHHSLNVPEPEVYLPWPRFNSDKRVMLLDHYYVLQPQPEAFAIAAAHHPNWGACGPAARKLHARNVHQVLGPDVTAPTPSRFIICWSKNAAGEGGTGQAIRIAKAYDIPVFDLADRDTLDRVIDGLI